MRNIIKATARPRSRQWMTQRCKPNSATPPNAAAVAMTGLANWVETQRPNATQDFALGAERFAQMLRDTEMVDIPLAELEAIGRADLQRNQQALTEACARYAPGASLPACMQRVNAQKPQGGAVAGARAQLAGLRAFIAEHDLVTIPGDGRSAGRRGAAVRAPELRLYRHPRPVRDQPAFGLLHLAARSELARASAGGLRAGRDRIAVRLRARSVAGPLPQLPARQPLQPAVRARVRGLCVTPKAGRTTPKR